MSVINQVLNLLEQRGVRPLQTTVRAVPLGRRRRIMSLLALVLVLALALLLASGIAELQWRQIFKPKQVAAGVIKHPENVPSAAPKIDAYADLAMPFIPPASRLSFELNSVALPVSHKNTQAPKPVRVAALAAQPQQDVSQAVVQSGVQSDVSKLKQISPAQQADGDFRKAAALQQQGRSNEAIAGFEAVLRLDADHDAASKALVALLLENKRGEDAERVLQEGLKVRPEHTGFAMLLARLQMEHDAVDQAEQTLEKSLPYAYALAGYQAFYAALMQRQSRHKKAISHFQTALHLSPDNGVWLMGYAISLQAEQRVDEARDAYQRSLESKTLNPELQAFVQQKLKAL